MIAGVIGMAAPAQAAPSAAGAPAGEVVTAAAFPAKPCKYVVGKPYRKGRTIMAKVWAGKCAQFPPDAIGRLWRSRWYGYQTLNPYATCKRKAGNCVVTVKYHCPAGTTYTYKATATLTTGNKARQWGPGRRIHCPAFIST
ncbi:hypothetical protein [Actinomadura monticuli]|uniref:Uncharacterized protein n=1 Tax=Actinomadura monticuli TaxID=3097367 RepID=A0ABV4Q484_9ACTN